MDDTAQTIISICEKTYNFEITEEHAVLDSSTNYCLRKYILKYINHKQLTKIKLGKASMCVTTLATNGIKNIVGNKVGTEQNAETNDVTLYHKTTVFIQKNFVNSDTSTDVCSVNYVKRRRYL